MKRVWVLLVIAACGSPASRPAPHYLLLQPPVPPPSDPLAGPVSEMPAPVMRRPVTAERVGALYTGTAGRRALLNPRLGGDRVVYADRSGGCYSAPAGPHPISARTAMECPYLMVGDEWNTCIDGLMSYRHDAFCVCERPGEQALGAPTVAECSSRHYSGGGQRLRRLNAEDAAGRPFVWSPDGCRVHLGSRYAPPPHPPGVWADTRKAACPAEMQDAAWASCPMGHLFLYDDGSCVCDHLEGDPPMPGVLAECPAGTR